MTYQQFLELLERTPRAWHVLGFVRNGKETREIRCGSELGGTQQCPISACANMPVGDWKHAADLLGMSPELACDIANVADGGEGVIARRQDVLRCCRVAELAAES